MDYKRKYLMATFSNFKSTLVAAADTAAGASSAATTIVADMAALIALTGMSDGDQAFVTANNNLYFYSSGWYKIATVSNDSPSSITGVSGSYALDTSGSTTTITAVSTDPEGFELTWSYSTSGLGSIATISQANNVFTITPSTNSADAGSFTLTISVTDGINGAVSASSTLSLVFTVTNSKYTTALITAVGTSDNNNITDASSNNSTITATGGVIAGTFSPYRVGGYSTYFGSSSNTYLTHSGSNFGLPSGTSASWTVECWVNLTNASSNQGFFQIGSITGFGILTIHANAGYAGADTQNGRIGGSGNSNATISSNTWTHLAVVKDGSNVRFYRNGVHAESTADSSDYSGTSNFYVGLYYSSSYCMVGYIRDLRVSSIDRYGSGTSSFTPPTEAFTSDSDTILLTCKDGRYGDLSSNSYSITPVGSVSVSTYNFLFDNNSPYSANSNGGSILLDGTNDYINTTVASAVGTGEFTYECWYYSTGDTNAEPLFDTRGDGTSGGIELRVHSNNIRIIIGSNTVSGTTSINNNRWNHIAAVRDSSNNIKVYVNGINDITSFTDSTNLTNTSLRIGAQYGATQYAQGYISDARYSKSAVYTADFTPPTSPLSSSGATLHVKGTDASIIDKAQTNNVLLSGVTGSTTQAKFANTKSIDVGSGVNYAVAQDIDGDFGTGNFTIECWIWPETLNTSYGTSSLGTVLDLDVSLGSGTTWWVIHQNNNGGLDFASNSAVVLSSTNSVLTAQTWQHIAVVRSGGTIAFYVDGISRGTTSNSNSIGSVRDLYIGRQSGQNRYFKGYIQDVRITKGLARYTNTFTPPTGELQG